MKASNLETKLAFEGPTTGYVETIIEEIHTDKGKVESAKKNDLVSVKVTEKVRENDKIFLIKERNLN